MLVVGSRWRARCLPQPIVPATIRSRGQAILHGTGEQVITVRSLLIVAVAPLRQLPIVSLKRMVARAFRDSTGAPDSWLLPEHRVVKTFTYLFDVHEDGGCTTLVPGTHRLPGGPRETLRCRFAGAANDFGLAAAGAAEQGDVEPVAARLMPNQLPIVVQAGTVFCFDNSVWHTVSCQ
jgi:hypothetical protein